MKKAINATAYLTVLVLSVLFIAYGNRAIKSRHAVGGLNLDREEELDTLIFAKIISLDGELQDGAGGTKISFSAATFGDGKNEGETIRGSQILNSGVKNTPPVSVGDKVVVMSYGENYLFQYYYRFDKIVVLGLVMAFFILLMGGIKGFNTILSLSLTCLSIFLIFIPSIKAGYDIYLSTVIICVYIITETLVIVYGLGPKSVITAVSCTAGVVFSGWVSLVMDRWMKLTGYINNDTYFLKTLFGFDVDVKAIMFSMITIGALGAIMDVSMSVTSPLCELKETGKDGGSFAMMKYGFHIGRDFMGTMTSTLILAYMGSSMIVVLVYAVSGYPLLSLLNKEEIIFEFLQSLVGSLGILFTIPFTTVIASLALSGGSGGSSYRRKKRGRRRF
ncbi:MAG TPA: YibE/F family protein [Terriglobales bacterium]|nr:YibE/F family protein [Terriglobales bacterium]